MKYDVIHTYGGLRGINTEAYKMQSIGQNMIIINSRGVKTSDPRGNQYFQNVRQHNINMTQKYFNDAQKYWANVKINGVPVSLQEVAIQIAANNSVPYNYLSNKEPVVGDSNDNRFFWYNAEFNMGDDRVNTGWICGGGMSSPYMVCESAAEMVAYGLYKDAVYHNGIKQALQKLR